MSHVLGVYCLDDKVCKLKVQTGRNALFLTEADAKPGQHVWARYGNMWYHFHVLKEFDTQKAASDEEMEFCSLVVAEKEKQQSGLKESRLVCCALANLEHDLPLPPVPNELAGKTQFPDIVASPEFIHPNLEPEEVEPVRKKRKLHPAVKTAPKRILEKYNIKQKPVNVPQSNATNEVLLRELITVVYGLQNQMKTMDAKLNVLDERTKEWTVPMNELKRRHKNFKRCLEKKNKKDQNAVEIEPSVPPASPIIVPGPLDHATVPPASPIIVPGPLDHATVPPASPIIVSGPLDHATVPPASPIIVPGPLDHATVPPASPIIISGPLELAAPSTPVDFEKYVPQMEISQTPHASTINLERNTPTSTPVTPKDVSCRFFRKNGITLGIRATKMPKARAPKEREQLIAQSTLNGDKITFIGPIKIPTTVYISANRQMTVSAYLRKLAPYFFSVLEMATSSVYGGKAAGLGMAKEYLPIHPVRLGLLLESAEKRYPNRFSKSTALIANYSERSKAPLYEETTAAIKGLSKLFHEYKMIDITQVAEEFGKEFGVGLNIQFATDDNFKLIDTAEKNCKEIVGLSHIRIR